MAPTKRKATTANSGGSQRPSKKMKGQERVSDNGHKDRVSEVDELQVVSPLEGLPTELLQSIWLYSFNPDLPRSSLCLSAILNNPVVRSDFIEKLSAYLDIAARRYTWRYPIAERKERVRALLRSESLTPKLYKALQKAACDKEFSSRTASARVTCPRLTPSEFRLPDVGNIAIPDRFVQWPVSLGDVDLVQELRRSGLALRKNVTLKSSLKKAIEAQDLAVTRALLRLGAGSVLEVSYVESLAKKASSELKVACLGSVLSAAPGEGINREFRDKTAKSVPHLFAFMKKHLLIMDSTSYSQEKRTFIVENTEENLKKLLDTLACFVRGPRYSLRSGFTVIDKWD